MRVGTILLTMDNEYVSNNGKLPKRPKNDKDLLTSICKGQLVSEEAYNMLPLSIQDIVMVSDNPTVPISIKELAKSEILLVNRSSDINLNGKKFRLDNFKYIGKVELWIMQD